MSDNTAEVKGREIEMTGIEGVNTTLEIQGEPVIAMRLRDRVTEQSRIRGRMITPSR